MFIRKTAEIPIDLIKANEQQPRQVFGQEQLMELRDSIKEFGVLQPLILKKDTDGKYLLIAGERRLRAAAMAGLDKVPAVIKEASEEETSLIALVENIQRENLGYIEEARAYKNIMEKYGMSQMALSEKLGKNQSTISNKIRILSLPDEIQDMLVKNQLTERHARALLKIENDNLRHTIVSKVVKHGLNVKQTEKLVDDYLEQKERQDREKNKIRHISYKLYLNTLKRTFNDMELEEKGATFKQEDLGNNLRIVITIPKEIQGMLI